VPEPYPAVDVRGLTRRFGGHDGIDLSVAVGECLGLLGPNGAGKTTIRLLVTPLPARDGEVRSFGLDVRRRPIAVRRLLGYVPQQLSVEAALTGREDVAWPARLFDIPRRERAGRVDEALAMMALTDVADRLAATCSGGHGAQGNRRRPWSTGLPCWCWTSPPWVGPGRSATGGSGRMTVLRSVHEGLGRDAAGPCGRNGSVGCR
jgi:alpha-D-ribose 1-methylphosphonate 5-triphosphate synthase subunit PhnL